MSTWIGVNRPGGCWVTASTRCGTLSFGPWKTPDLLMGPMDNWPRHCTPVIQDNSNKLDLEWICPVGVELGRPQGARACLLAHGLPVMGMAGKWPWNVAHIWGPRCLYITIYLTFEVNRTSGSLVTASARCGGFLVAHRSPLVDPTVSISWGNLEKHLWEPVLPHSQSRRGVYHVYAAWILAAHIQPVT